MARNSNKKSRKNTAPKSKIFTWSNAGKVGAGVVVGAVLAIYGPKLYDKFGHPKG